MNDINFKAMKLRLFILVLVCLGTSTFLKAQQHRLDTVYYDKEWKGVNIPVFASFYRIYDSSDTSIPKRCKTFYISGELYSDAAFISLDKKDDNNTVFDGRTVIYYPNGNIKYIIDYSNGVYDGLYEYYYENGKLGQKSEFVNGKYDGLHCTYDENGVIKEESNCKEGTYDGNSVLYYDSGNVKIRQRYKSGELDGKYTEYAQGGQIIKECHYKDGWLDGLYTQFLDNGNFKQLEYDAGIPKTEYYYLGTPTGQMSRYYLSDNKPYWEPMKEEDRKVTYRNGETWAYYSQNGLTIAMTNSYSNEYGKWWKLDIIITNDSIEPIVFDPHNGIVAYSSKGDKTTILEVWPCYEYTNRVRKRQNTGEFFYALGEAVGNMNAGYTTSTTQTNQLYGGTINSYGVGATVGAAVGSDGYAVGGAVGAYAGSTSYLGGSLTTSTTVTYDATAAYIQNAISGQRIAALHNTNLEERAAIEKGYLEITTVYPGETISGFVYVERRPADYVEFDFNVEGNKYKFKWR